MAAGEPGQSARLDSATQGLRQVLLQAEDDAERLRALETIAQRSVVAPTWPSSPEAVRTLTNSDGEHAMPLFSAVDTLQAAARRFGWAQPDGSLAFRELPAREALRSALEQGVHYVVLDIFAEHATEFSREEVAQVLQRRPAAAPRVKEAPANAAPVVVAVAPAAAPAAAPAVRAPDLRAAAPAARAPAPARPAAAKAAPKAKPGAAILGEIDMPFASRRNAGKPAPRAAIEEPRAPVRREGSPRIDPRAEPPSQPALRAAARADSALLREAPPANRPQVLRAPSTLKEQPAPRAERAGNVTPAAFAPPPPPPLPALESLPPVQMPASAPAPLAAAAPPQLDALPSFHPSAAPPLPPPDAAPPLGFDFAAQPEPEANPGALQAAAMVAQVAKLSGDAGTQKAAAEVAAMLTDMARKGVVEEAKPSAAQSAAKLLAGMLAADAAATDGRRNKRAESKQAMAAVEPEPQSAPETVGLRPLDPPLPDALLDLIADALRKFPEVEWACELSDGSPLPVVGVRIDPSFQTRAGEVRAAVLAVASKRKTELAVLLLSDAQVMKEARANGSAFFPWRKRAAKR